MKPIILNWKINMTYGAIQTWINSFPKKLLEDIQVIPSYFAIFHLLADSKQVIHFNQIVVPNVSAYDYGDETGQVSFLEAKELNLNTVLINHHELIDFEQKQGITKYLNKKVQNLVYHGFNLVVCLGTNIIKFIEENNFIEIIKELISNEINRLFEGTEILNDTKITFVFMPTFLIKNNIHLSNDEIDKQMIIVGDVLKKYFKTDSFDENIQLIYGGPIRAENYMILNKYGIFVDSGYDVNYLTNLLEPIYKKDDTQEKT